MGSERQCGLSSLLPMSCRGRAEAFARRLHTRLRRLGTEPGGSAHEATWLTGPPPPHHADSDVFFDFDVELESPNSPVDEIPEADHPLAQNHRTDPESGCVFSSPVDNESPPSNSDSDATYYDLENDPLSNYLKHHKAHDDNHISKNLNKIKLSTPASEIIDHLLQNKAISPERQSPIRTQPLARENGFADYGSLEKRDSSNNLYSAINFDDCKKRKDTNDKVVEESVPEEPVVEESVDEVDSVSISESYYKRSPSPEASCIDEDPTNDEEDSYTKSCASTDEAESDLIETSTKEDESSNEEVTVIRLEVTEDPKPDEEETVPDEAVDTNFITTQECEEVFPDDGDDRPQRVRRCSSLRTGKTPPGTPGRKKIVRFADVLGLDLADVKTFMDDIPNIPKSAFEDLRDADVNQVAVETFVSQEGGPMNFDKKLVPLFQQPGDQPNFLDILNTRCVCLENAVVQEGTTIAVYGTVKVRNVDFHKSVQIRYSLDSWKSFSDLQATYVPNSCDGFSDRFQFLLYAHTLTTGQKLEFAVRFMCKGCQFWDNNQGSNYVFQCISTNGPNSFYASQPLSPVNSWHASFY